MPIERLPYTPINYPVLNYPVIPRPPVTPWALIAANLARTIEQTAKDLSPAERQRKALELAILGAQARQASMSADYQDLVLQNAKKNSQAGNAAKNDLDDAYNGAGSVSPDAKSGTKAPDFSVGQNPTTLSLGGPNDPNVKNPMHDLGEPDTGMASYYGHVDPGFTIGEPITVDQDYKRQAQAGVEEGAPMTMDLNPSEPTSTDALSAFSDYNPMATSQTTSEE